MYLCPHSPHPVRHRKASRQVRFARVRVEKLQVRVEGEEVRIHIEGRRVQVGTFKGAGGGWKKSTEVEKS